MLLCGSIMQGAPIVAIFFYLTIGSSYHTYLHTSVPSPPPFHCTLPPFFCTLPPTVPSLCTLPPSLLLYPPSHCTLPPTVPSLPLYPPSLLLYPPSLLLYPVQGIAQGWPLPSLPTSLPSFLPSFLSPSLPSALPLISLYSSFDSTTCFRHCIGAWIYAVMDLAPKFRARTAIMTAKLEKNKKARGQ